MNCTRGGDLKISFFINSGMKIRIFTRETSLTKLVQDSYTNFISCTCRAIWCMNNRMCEKKNLKFFDIFRLHRFHTIQPQKYQNFSNWFQKDKFLIWYSFGLFLLMEYCSIISHSYQANVFTWTYSQYLQYLQIHWSGTVEASAD